jgi:glucokinase
MKAFAVDLGGGHATCALVEDRSVLNSCRVSTDGAIGLGPALPRLADALRGLLVHGRGTDTEPAGLAFGFCGLVDYTRSRIVSTNAKYDDAPALDLSSWCQSNFGIPLKMDNDARMALLGEWYAGAARGSNDVVMVTLGTGIGGAAMVQGRLFRGKHSQAGCLGGHLPVNFEGRKCTCGAIGCAESEAATWSLPAVCRNTAGYESSGLAQDEPVTFAKLFCRVDQGDPVARKVFERCLKVWGVLLVGLIHAYDPEVIVVGGGVMQSASRVLPFLQAYVERHAWTPWGKVRVLSAELGNDAGLLGAVPLLQGLTDL